MPERAVHEVLSGDLDPALLLQRIADEGLRLVPAAQGANVLIHRDGTVRIVATAGILESEIGREYAVEEVLGSSALSRDSVIWCDDVTTDLRVRHLHRRDNPVRSFIAAPLYRDDALVAMLCVVSSRLAAFSGEDVTTVMSVGEFAGVAVSVSREVAAAARRTFDAVSRPTTVVNAAGAARDHRGHRRRAAEFVTELVQPGAVATLRTRRRVQEALDGGGPRCVVQPLVDLRDGTLIAAEALARFDGLPRRSPDIWFAEAHSVGLGIELERLAVRRALDAFDAMPWLPGLGINVSRDLLLEGGLLSMLADHRPERLTIELTEHVLIRDYRRVREAADELRALGVALAIDDVGAGYSSLRHLAELEPDDIKLDRVFIERAEHERVWATMARALVELASEMGVQLIAEGIETADQVAFAQDLGIRVGQGYFIARPADPDEMPRAFPHVVVPRRLRPRSVA